jgi:hypothetical protein
VVVVAAVEEEEELVVVVEVVVDHNHNLVVVVHNIVVEEVQTYLMDHKVDFVDNHIVEMDVVVQVDHYSNRQDHHHTHN